VSTSVYVRYGAGHLAEVPRELGEVLRSLQGQRRLLLEAAREATDVHYECRCTGCERLRMLIREIEGP
jgi:hypothetical protein